MRNHRPSTWIALSLLTLLIARPATAFLSDEVTGIVKSVDVEGKKVVVIPTGKETTVDVSFTDKTIIKSEEGDVLTLKALKAGDGVGIAHKEGVALNVRVSVKPEELVGHVRSVGNDLKTFVVTQVGTTTDATVAVNEGTSIVTTEGKKLELKELKKGDGVGIAHTNSLASRIVVNVKPIEKQSD